MQLDAQAPILLGQHDVPLDGNHEGTVIETPGWHKAEARLKKLPKKGNKQPDGPEPLP